MLTVIFPYFLQYGSTCPHYHLGQAPLRIKQVRTITMYHYNVAGM